MMINSIGFVGTGAITEAMVRGLLAAPAYASEVHVSPRSAHIAATLAEEFAAVRIAGDNQIVVDRSDMVFLAIRPQLAEEVVRALSFRKGQMV
ncbi:NAD(P)-binding domain-containing protein, partial [Rhizobium phaseoli]